MKYKLIKEYPGSPRLNTVIDDEITTFGVSFAKNNLNSIENHSEFWQPVVEKNYEILSYITVESEIIKYKDLDIDDDCNCDKYLKIYSVKRLSDGEIFTIGDIIKCEDCKGEITSLEIYDDDIYLTGIDNKMPFGYTLCNALDCFEIPQKAKQKLFISEDGVDIFEGDTVWHTNLNTNKKPYSSIVEYKEPFTPVKGLFSTKEKAEEYIIMNKPCLSLKDVKLKLSSMSGTIGMRMLRELVKSKI